MRSRTGPALVFALAGVLLTLVSTPADALRACKAVASDKDGVVRVYAKGVLDRADFEWAPDLDAPFEPFANAGTCLKGERARGCQLGADGTPESTWPPEGCVIYMTDGIGQCAARVRGCTPGVRNVDEMADEVVALREEVDLLRSQLDAILSVVRVEDGDVVIDTRTGGGDVRIEGLNVTVDASATAEVNGTAQATLRSSASTAVEGSLVSLAGGGRPVARLGETVAVDCSSGPCGGTVVGGSAVVLVP